MQMSRQKVSRRGFLRTTIAGAAVTAAGAAAEVSAARAGAPKTAPQYADYLKDLDKGEETETPTEGNIEGPFYRPGAPFLGNGGKLPGADKGDVIRVDVTIVARNGKPIKGAEMDLWHSSAAGHYDNGDPDDPPPNDKYSLRGRFLTDEKGAVWFQSVRPGHYSITAELYRTAHIHFIIRAEGYQTLTSQFFFKGEQYSKTDPWFKPSMVLDLKPDGDGFRAKFKIVLTRA
jgi:protocatechuate 3,4-dioxygenase beta subunit